MERKINLLIIHSIYRYKFYLTPELYFVRVLTYNVVVEKLIKN